LVPLVTSDIAGHSGRYNLALGVIGLAVGGGATLSTALVGWVGDRWGDTSAFAALAGFGLAACTVVAVAMPETKP
jgi:predicted MFS family arabinose efflux permease